MPVDPAMAVTGTEWSIGPVQAPAGPGAAAGEGAKSGGSSFGDMLGGAIESLSATQADAAAQSQALATGQATDITAVVSSVEKARLSMELASQLRNKAVEAYTDIWRTQA